MDVFAQSEYEPSTVKLKNNVGNSITVPSLPDKKNLTFGGKFTGKEDGFVFGIIADRTGGNPIIGWPYFEQAIRDMNVLHPDFVIMPGDLVDSYINREDSKGVTENFSKEFNEKSIIEIILNETKSFKNTYFIRSKIANRRTR